MNQENKKQIIVAGVLGVVLVLVLVYQFAIAGGKPPVIKDTGSTTAAKPAAASSSTSTTAGPKTPTRLKQVNVNLKELQAKVQEVTFRYEDKRISRNPMTPLVGRISSGPGGVEIPVGPGSIYDIAQKKVTGIIYNDYKPLAVVDGEVVSEGHPYTDGVVLTKIEPKRVWFKWGDSEIPVELKEL